MTRIFSISVCWIIYGYYREKFHVNHSGSERFNCPSSARVIYFLVFLILDVIVLSAVPGHNWSHFRKSRGWMGNWQVWSQEYDNVVRCTICSGMAAYQLCSEYPNALLWSDHHRNGLWCSLTCCSSKLISYVSFYVPSPLLNPLTL